MPLTHDQINAFVSMVGDASDEQLDHMRAMIDNSKTDRAREEFMREARQRFNDRVDALRKTK